METDLTRDVLAYQKSGTGYKELIDKIALLVYNHPPMRRKWSEDECGDFLCHFYPRIKRMIASFEDRGKPFEALLSVALKWQMKGYALNRTKQQKQERFLRTVALWNMPDSESTGEFVEESPDEFSPSIKQVLKIDERGVISNSGLRNRLLFLLLLDAKYVSERHVQVISRLTGYTVYWLEEKLEKARQLLINREQKLKAYRNRQYSALFELYHIQERLLDCLDPEEREVLSGQLEHISIKVRKAEEGIRKNSRGPSHREIAEILQVPKGTVDSGLYYLRKKLSKVRTKPIPGKVVVT